MVKSLCPTSQSKRDSRSGTALAPTVAICAHFRSTMVDQPSHVQAQEKGLAKSVVSDLVAPFIEPRSLL